VLLEALAGSPAAFIAITLALGLLVGSFLNVVIYRVPVMLDRQWREQCAELAAGSAGTTAATATPAAQSEPFNLVVPRSRCPGCKAPITAVQNIPVFSWLFLRGRCAGCGTPISVRYPIIEAFTGIASALVAWKFGFGWPALAALVLTWYLIALTFIDVDTQLLPDNMTLPLMWLGLLFALWGPDSGEGPLPVDLRTSVIGAVAGYVSLWSVFHLFKLLTGKEGMGYGDFKLFAALGAWLGWQMLLPIILIAAAVGAITGIAMLSVQGKDRATPIAFGPYLAAAGWLMLLFGPELVNRYLGMFGQHL
jgi:leader peptidase (prepilin peptidase) / N-methyltransferase